MKYRSRFSILVGVLYILCALTQNSFALVTSGGGNLTAPTLDPGWDNVGKMSIGSGTYLGDGWVLTAFHVYSHDPDGASHIDLDQRYYEVPGTARRLEYSSTTSADLVMFRIDGNPDLPMIGISSSSPLNQEITIIANGRSPLGDLVDFGGGYEGFQLSSVKDKRWGRNETSGYVSSTSSAYGRTKTFKTYFDSLGLGDDECQPVVNDSGASVFAQVSEDNWALAGVALSVGTPNGYTGPNVVYNAVYGNHAYYADLASYRSQIDAIRLVPLPGDADWDGDVDSVDIDILKATFGQTGSDLQADFNDDDTVNLSDFAIIREYFGKVSGNGVPGAEGLPLQMVPEPATLILMAAGLPLLMKRKRKSR